MVRRREEFRRSSRSRACCIANVLLAVLFCPVSAWCWGSDGHQIVAIIASDNLTQAAQSHVANILGVPANQTAVAMEAASVRPDSEFREEDRSTAPWHYIDICLQDQRINVPARCLAEAAANAGLELSSWLHALGLKEAERRTKRTRK